MADGERSDAAEGGWHAFGVRGGFVLVTEMSSLRDSTPANRRHQLGLRNTAVDG